MTEQYGPSSIGCCDYCNFGFKQNVNIHKVEGEGPLSADLMFVGEAPGREENIKRRPFVGYAGLFLEAHLENAGLKREEVFITNIVKCRPPENRRPTYKECERCSVFLRLEIGKVNPKIIIALGRTSEKWLKSQEDIKSKYPIVFVYHPSPLNPYRGFIPRQLKEVLSFLNKGKEREQMNSSLASDVVNE